MRISQPPSPQTCAGTVEWIKRTLSDPENEDCDVDDVIREVANAEWQSENELIDFFRILSIELAQTACRTPYEETAELFGRSINYGLSLWSPYYAIWEQAFKTKSSRLQDSIDITEWESDIDSGIEELSLVCLIPLATAYEQPLFETLRNKTIIDPTSNQEEFLGYVAAMLGPGYYDGDLPTEIINIPSTKILCEILEDWCQYRALWNPEVIKDLLASDHANDEVKRLVAQVLQGESNSEPEEWDEHREEYWTTEDLEDVLKMCN